MDSYMGPLLRCLALNDVPPSLCRGQVRKCRQASLLTEHSHNLGRCLGGGVCCSKICSHRSALKLPSQMCKFPVPLARQMLAYVPDLDNSLDGASLWP